MLHQSPLLYQPTAEEVEKVAASAKRRHPELASRIDKAADIIASGSLQLEALGWKRAQLARWRIASQSHGGAYVVTTCGCPCQDNRAPVVAHSRRCKHTIAVSLYLKVLANHLNANIRAREIDLGILPDGTFNAYAKGMGIVHLRKLGSAYVFVDMASAVRFSMWLAVEQPIAIEWPTAVESMVAA
jgi:hypothetical protein